jgi:hypothetical protein
MARSCLARFVTYEQFISLLFKFFWGHSEPRITETTDTESADTGAQLYFMQIKVEGNIGAVL